MDFFGKILDVSDFPARWHCGNWSPSHGWLHIVSDVMIWGAYMAIPILLLYFIRKRGDVPFSPIFFLFAAFICACGTSHLIEASIFWWPAYRLAGIVKFITAVVSWATVFALLPVIPKALSMPRIEEDNIRLTSAVDWLQNIFDSTPEAIIVVDANGVITYSNSSCEHLFGYDQQELTGMSVHNLVPNDTRANHPDLFENYMKSPVKRAMGYGRDLFGTKKDGATVPVEIGLNPVEFNGEPHVVASIVDISERIQAKNELIRLNDELVRSNAELDEFAYVASHDMRSPLNGIEDLASWIEEDAGDTLPKESKRHLGLIRSRIQRAKQLLDDLLEYSRVGRTEQTLEQVDTKALIESIIRENDGERETVANIPDDMPTVDAPSTPYYQVWSNLICNAIRHNDKETCEINITYHDRPGEYEFRVEDNGPGISTEFHAKVFEQFQTLQSRDVVEGSGMGLAICAKVVEWVGGRIWVESDGKTGSAFIFTWPKEIDLTPVERKSDWRKQDVD